MNLLNKTLKGVTFILLSGLFASSAIAGGGCGGGGSKAEKVAKYKTTQMVAFVNSTIDFLNSQEDPNQRHLKVLKNCQKTFNSGRPTAKGMEGKNLKICKNLMSRGGYDLKSVAVKVSEDPIPNKKEPIAIKKVSEKKINKIAESRNSTTSNESDLLLF